LKIFPSSDGFISTLPGQIKAQLFARAQNAEVLYSHYHCFSEELNLNGRYSFGEFKRMFAVLHAMCDVFFEIEATVDL
jgi:hypothetical protein